MDRTTTRHYYHCIVSTTDALDCVIGLPEGSGSTQALVCIGQSLQLLQQAAPWDNGLSLSEQKRIRIIEPQQHAPTPRHIRPRLSLGCWDAFSGCTFALYGAAVMRLSEGGDATIVAGHLTERGDKDGPGQVARFGWVERGIMSDGEGRLYVLSSGRVRLLQLPAAWKRSAPAAGSATGDQHHVQQQQQQPDAGPAEQSRGAAGEATVTTLRFGDIFCGRFRYGSYDPLTRSLILCADQRVYRLHMGELLAEMARAAQGATEAAPAAAAGGGPTAGIGAEEGASAAGVEISNPVLMADLQAAHSTDAPVVQRISGATVDGEGNVWVTACKWEDDDYAAGGLGTLLYRVDTTGGVVPVAAGSGALGHGQFREPTILRNGSIAMVANDEYAPEQAKLLLLHLELKPPLSSKCTFGPVPSSSGSSSSCPSHTLASDLGALLARQPDGSADVEVEVGGQVFAAHRSVLAARSPYFRQRLDPGAGFADAGGPRLSLPDADPGAFAAVLRYMYTDSVGAVPPELLQPVGELADRLLLPGLCSHVGQQLLWQVRPDNVVGLLLWADRHKCSYGALLSGLKQWFLGHHAKGEGGWVLPDREVLQLMREGPEELVMELLYHQRPDVRGCKRQRQG